MAIVCGSTPIKVRDIIDLVNSNEIKINQDGTDIATLKTKVATNEQEIVNIKQRLTVVENSGTNLGTLNTRVTQLEQENIAIHQLIDTNRTDITSNTSGLSHVVSVEIPQMKLDIIAASGGGYGPTDVDPANQVSGNNKLATQATVDEKITAATYLPKIIVLRDERNFQTVDAAKGGTSVKDVWTKRKLGPLGLSVPVEAGTYSIVAEVPGAVGTHQSRLVNSVGNVLLVGTVSTSMPTTAENSLSMIIGSFVLAADDNLSIETIHDASIVDVGFGVGTAFPQTNSVYTSAIITKIR